MTNHPHRSKRKVVTYSWTAGGNNGSTISLCAKHDTTEHRMGYGQVSHGLHIGQCTICAAAERDAD